MSRRRRRRTLPKKSSRSRWIRITQIILLIILLCFIIGLRVRASYFSSKFLQSFSNSDDLRIPNAPPPKDPS